MLSNTTDQLIRDIEKNFPPGFDLSLDRISELLNRLGNPHHSLPPVIHIAGTNGKGSTAAFSRSLLESAGYSVHVHTSPHLVKWHERFQSGGSWRRKICRRRGTIGNNPLCYQG